MQKSKSVGTRTVPPPLKSGSSSGLSLTSTVGILRLGLLSRRAAGRERYGPLLNSTEAADHERLLDVRLIPNVSEAVLRIYVTQSTHKSLTSFRQGSMGAALLLRASQP